MVMGLNYAAWIQVSEGNVPVIAMVKTSTKDNFAGAIFAESNCWSMLKGGFTAQESGPAELYFEVLVPMAFYECVYVKFSQNLPIK